MSNKLLNDSDIHNVNLKLDKNKAREYALRVYLDSKVKAGMTRKEAILQLLENNQNESKILDATMYENKKSLENIDTVKMKEPNIADYDNI